MSGEDEGIIAWNSDNFYPALKKDVCCWNVGLAQLSAFLFNWLMHILNSHTYTVSLQLWSPSVINAAWFNTYGYNLISRSLFYLFSYRKWILFSPSVVSILYFVEICVTSLLLTHFSMDFTTEYFACSSWPIFWYYHIGLYAFTCVQDLWWGLRETLLLQ